MKEFVMVKTCDYLQSVLNEQIPITQALQVKVLDWKNHQLTLSMPLQPNINHMSSAFGGSLYCGAVLAGWGWMHLRLKELGAENAHIVIQDGQISYPYPVLGDVVIECPPPSEAEWDKFERIFKRRSKGRLSLSTSVIYDGKEAVVFNGQFVVYCD